MTLIVTGTHPYADKFPMLPAGEHEELRESIRANGLRSPIVVTPDGLILDGRNRHKCCTELGIEPEMVIYDGEDLAEYVIDCNVTRRNMSTGARAMSTALVLAEDGRRANGRWKRGSVVNPDSGTNDGKTWQNQLNSAGIVLDFAPDLAGKVVAGDLALDAAYQQACGCRDAEARRIKELAKLVQQEAEAKKFVKANDPDLAAQVGDNQPFRTFAEALAIWQQRNRDEAAQIAKEKADKAKRDAQERQARTDLYTDIARSLDTLAVYGQYEDIPKLMADYNPAELDPPQYARAFTAEALRSAKRFVTELVRLETR